MHGLKTFLKRYFGKTIGELRFKDWFCSRLFHAKIIPNPTLPDACLACHLCPKNGNCPKPVNCQHKLHVHYPAPAAASALDPLWVSERLPWSYHHTPGTQPLPSPAAPFRPSPQRAARPGRRGSCGPAGRRAALTWPSPRCEPEREKKKGKRGEWGAAAPRGAGRGRGRGPALTMAPPLPRCRPPASRSPLRSAPEAAAARPEAEASAGRAGPRGPGLCRAAPARHGLRPPPCPPHPVWGAEGARRCGPWASRRHIARLKTARLPCCFAPTQNWDYVKA